MSCISCHWTCLVSVFFVTALDIPSAHPLLPLTSAGTGLQSKNINAVGLWLIFMDSFRSVEVKTPVLGIFHILLGPSLRPNWSFKRWVSLEFLGMGSSCGVERLKAEILELGRRLSISGCHHCGVCQVCVSWGILKLLNVNQYPKEGIGVMSLRQGGKWSWQTMGETSDYI